MRVTGTNSSRFKASASGAESHPSLSQDDGTPALRTRGLGPVP